MRFKKKKWKSDARDTFRQAQDEHHGLSTYAIKGFDEDKFPNVQNIEDHDDEESSDDSEDFKFPLHDNDSNPFIMRNRYYQCKNIKKQRGYVPIYI